MNVAPWRFTLSAGTRGRAVTGAVAIIALLTSAPVSACCTGLVLIPTADVMEPGEYGIEVQFDGALGRGTADTRILNTELGLSRRLEAGLDLDLSEDAPSRTLLNAKYVVTGDGERIPAVAVGICNARDHLRSNPYVVVTQGLGDLRGHFGIARIEGNDRWFAGAEWAVGRRLTLMSDYTSGSENASSVGVNYQADERFSVLAGAVFPNTRGADTQFTVHFVLSGPCHGLVKED